MCYVELNGKNKFKMNRLRFVLQGGEEGENSERRTPTSPSFFLHRHPFPDKKTNPRLEN